MLRYMAWLCLKDDKLKGSQMCIITGPREDLAITLIDRMKGLFQNRLMQTFETKDTVKDTDECLGHRKYAVKLVLFTLWYILRRNYTRYLFRAFHRHTSRY
jgi:hypothetical protein